MFVTVAYPIESTGLSDMTLPEDDGYGALVGWTSEDLGERLVLRMQSVAKPPPHSAEDVRSFHFLMDKQQAVQLGNYLFRVTGETAPQKPKRSWFVRLTGG